MTEIYLHFLFVHYGLYGNAPVLLVAVSSVDVCLLLAGLTVELSQSDQRNFADLFRAVRESDT